MKITVIILSIITLFLLRKLWKKRTVIDYAKLFSNRKKLLEFAREEFTSGKISKRVYGILNFVFHPDFKNTFDYVPPERQDYTRQMWKFDSGFWEYYKIGPDFVLPVEMVYELYKSYIDEHMSDIPESDSPK